MENKKLKKSILLRSLSKKNLGKSSFWKRKSNHKEIGRLKSFDQLLKENSELLSNKHPDSCRAKYKLVHAVRTNKGAYDKAYNCVYEQEDPQGKVGINLSKDLMVIGEALKSNITTIGPLVLPASEQLLFQSTLIGRKIFLFTLSCVNG